MDTGWENMKDRAGSPLQIVIDTCATNFMEGDMGRAMSMPLFSTKTWLCPHRSMLPYSLERLFHCVLPVTCAWSICKAQRRSTGINYQVV